ncbi:helix-hairpin-helix domain-containing protein [Bacillus sp. SM2101]|uniref:ComEA family DNA-binding protein n=1 Tax=Bacillus sp. SM2101 TaxID=2805366 RepID=UPI001BDEA83F|nr:helix-hairpin-helix domain-containing protein [Bacillus sp. SM2101]
MAPMYTGKGKYWELTNSWWILLTLLPFGITSFISFLFVGVRVKKPRWIVYGLVYLAVCIVVFILPTSGITALTALLFWIISVIHAYKIRPIYLIQLDVLQSKEKVLDNQKYSKLRQEAKERFNVSESTITRPPKPQTATKKRKLVNSEEITTPTPVDTVQVNKINLNIASEREIASIPEIGIILAKKVVIKRQEIGGFQSFKEFSEIMQLKERAIQNIEKKVTFSHVDHISKEKKSGRVIDY